jgi:hypothetical protein
MGELISDRMFKDLIFEAKNHRYLIHNKKGIRYLPSVSSIVESFVPPFNEEKMLILSAKKQNTTPDELRKTWRQINADACILGTKTHRFLETYTGLETPTSPQERAGVKYIKSLWGTYEISFRELKAYSKKYLYAGTMDLPLRVLGTNSYVIDDYKTNGDLFKAYNYLFPPFETMEASPFNKYQIQLSLYQIMLEEVGVVINNRRLVYLKPDGEFKIYPLFDFTKDLRDYLKTRIA